MISVYLVHKRDQLRESCSESSEYIKSWELCQSVTFWFTHPWPRGKIAPYSSQWLEKLSQASKKLERTMHPNVPKFTNRKIIYHSCTYLRTKKPKSNIHIEKLFLMPNLHPDWHLKIPSWSSLWFEELKIDSLCTLITMHSGHCVFLLLAFTCCVIYFFFFFSIWNAPKYTRIIFSSHTLPKHPSSNICIFRDFLPNSCNKVPQHLNFLTESTQKVWLDKSPNRSKRTQTGTLSWPRKCCPVVLHPRCL